MRVLKVDPDQIEPEPIQAAAAVLRSGGLVAIPTETVYGLAANALDPAAVERIFQAKSRPSFNPLIAHCASLADARALADPWPEMAEVLGGRFWPGPLTLVVQKAGHVPDRLTAGLSTVALRVPSHPVAHALLRELEFPLAAPSANPFTRLSPTSSAHVLKGLAGKVDLVLDAGESALGIESTVVDVSGTLPVLLRPGSLPVAIIEEALGKRLGTPRPTAETEARPGPGMVAKHYSPRARLVVAPSHELAELAVDASDTGAVVGAILLESSPPPHISHPFSIPMDPVTYGSRLYAALHDLDDLGCELILVEAPPAEPDWAAVRDRLTRASQAS